MAARSKAKFAAVADATHSPSLLLPLPLAVPDCEDTLLTSREFPQPPHAYRSAFARDSARILHAKSFRRLAGKTQVFTRRSEESDHSRSRLTHTFEVTQIARTLATALGLNPALTEALGLVHDIGHPPFGHAGEAALDQSLRSHGLGFDHNLHALRIVTSFEERYAEFPGLNLTFAVREGIVKHSRDYPPEAFPELSEYLLGQLPPLEAQLIDLADEIAYLTADIEDGLSARILSLAQVRDQVPLFATYYHEAELTYPAATPRLLTSEALRQMLNALVTDLMHEVHRQVRTLGIETLEDLRHAPARVASLSPAMEARRRQAKAFLYANLYQSDYLDLEHQHAAEVVQTLFAAWNNDPDLLPPDHRDRIEIEGVPRAVADYIAGMTDTYIEQAWSAFKGIPVSESLAEPLGQ